MYNLKMFEREDLTPIRKLLMMKAIAGGAAISKYTVTGNPVEFNTNIAKALWIVAAFSPVQAGSGDPSPDNVRPITGFSGANVYLSATGADDPDKQTFAVTFPALGKNLAVFEQGTLNLDDGTEEVSSTRIRTNFIPVELDEYYIASYESNGLQLMYGCGYDENKNFIGYGNPSSNLFRNTNPLIKYVRFIYGGPVSTDPVTPTEYWYQFEKGSTATAYEPYNATAYGGTLDVVNGVLTVEWYKLAKTWGDFSNKTSLGDNTRGTMNISAYPSKQSSAAKDAKCNIAPRGTGWSTDSIHFYTNEGSCVMFLPNDTDNSTEIQVVYPLANPLFYQLSPVEILSLIGDNVVWSDLNGDLTVGYKKKG